MSNLNELFAELKEEILDLRGLGRASEATAAEAWLYALDEVINNGEFAREEQDNYIG